MNTTSMRSSVFPAFACALALVVATAVSSSAQEVGAWRPERPNRALFGGGRGDTGQSLVLGGSIGTGVERVTFVDPSVDLADLTRLDDVISTNFSGSLSYKLDRARVGFDASVGGAARYYPQLDGAVPANRSGSAGGRWQLSKRTSINGAAVVSYQPLSVSTVFPGLFGAGQTDTTPLDYALADVGGTYVSQDARLELSQSLFKGTTASASYNTRRARFTDDQRMQSMQGWQAGIVQQLSRHLGLHLGYGSAFGRYEGSQATEPHPRSQTIDAGADYNRALSVSRRTSMTFRTGSTAVSDSGVTKYWLTGNASLQREIGRTWNATVGYDRRVDFLETLRQPTLADTVTVNFGGLITRRIQFHSGVGVAKGSIGLVGDANGYTAYQGSVGVTVGLGRLFGLRVDYSYDQYEFERGVDLTLPLARQIRRHGVRAGLDLWAPLFERARRTNAAR